MMFNKKQTILAFIFAAMLLVMCFSVHASELTAITVENVTGDMGETVTVPIKITNNTGICGARISISYDSRLTLTKVSKGEALSTLAMTKPGNLSSDPFNIVWDGTDADNTDGIMVLLDFIVPDELDTFDINVSYSYGDIVDGNLVPMEIITQNGSVTTGENGGEGGDPQQNDGITISIDSVTANSGGSVDVPIKIRNNTGICGATLSVSYDNRLTLTKARKGEALSTLAMTRSGSLSANPVRLVWDGTDEDSSDGTMAVLTFTVPNGMGKYDITISYTAGDIVGGGLMPLNPLIENGYIEVNSSFEVNVTVDRQKVTLAGQSGSGRIFAAFCTEQGKLLDLKAFDAQSDISINSVADAAEAKIMWWDDAMAPMCPAQIISISQ